MQVYVQYQTMFGQWITTSTAYDNSISVRSEMERVSAAYPGKRVRAIYQDGRIVDIL